jgi:cbb3-type cytochrome oxidase maturation protein
MDILFTLIPLSVALIFFVLVVLGWAVHAGQLDDLDTEAARILIDEPDASRRAPDVTPGFVPDSGPLPAASFPPDSAIGPTPARGLQMSPNDRGSK